MKTARDSILAALTAARPVFAFLGLVVLLLVAGKRLHREKESGDQQEQRDAQHRRADF